MKQTSLIQSWTRALNPTSNSRRPAAGESLPRCGPEQESRSTAPFDSNVDDQLLSTVFDQFDASAKNSPTCSTSEYGEATGAIDQTVLDALRKRKPISYRPTANDSENLDGFNLETGRSWIYPINATLRDYQFNITEQCLYKNTLVCLPTGLGKTFIAAVVMYNFLRWYPTGKSVFMAPTRPLVTQQLAACRQLTNLPAETTIELTGSTAQSKRRELWLSRRSFFLTPQVLVNDLEADICPAPELRLLIFDEAHKATGNHAYCQVLRLLTNPPHMHRQFRIVALSATPAADIQGVQTLIANLLIAHLEMRTETSADVKCFTQTRQLETVIVPMGPELRRFQDQLVACVRIPLERLRLRGALRSHSGDLHPERLAKYTVVKAREEWANSPQAACMSPMDAGSVHCDFGSVICLLHAMELLEQHGLRPLYQYLNGVLSGQRASPSVRAEMMRLPGVTQLWSALSNRLGVTATEPSSTQSPFHGGHPKLDKLKELLCDHFQSRDISSAGETRVIVFSQFRDSVDEIMHMLKQLRPLIRPACFMGQSAGIGRSNSPAVTVGPNSPATAPLTSRLSVGATGVSQRDQLRVMNAFREGVFNTLVSTCVGEEGLDVGQVDLIVCFDAFKSPIRLMQRLGRTGRKRLGRIVMLLTEGREERNHQVSMARSSSIHKALLEGGAYKRLAFYPHNPRMVPINIDPVVQFENLACLRAQSDLTSEKISHQIMHSTKRKSGRSSRRIERAPDSVRSHIEAVGLTNLNLRLTPIVPRPLLRLMDSTSDCVPVEKPEWFTSLYSVTSSDRLRSACERLQAMRSAAHVGLGPSTSTRHLVSVLRLCELHRFGLTRISYHALGLRSVDIETPLSQLITETDPGAPELTELSAPPLVKTEASSSTVKQDVSSACERKSPMQSQSYVDPNHAFWACFPSFRQGLVSDEFFVDPIVHQVEADAKSAINYFRSRLCKTSDVIDVNSLEAVWKQQLPSTVDTRVVRQKQQQSYPDMPIQPLMKLEQWVDESLLEAITEDTLQLPSEENYLHASPVSVKNSANLPVKVGPVERQFSLLSPPNCSATKRNPLAAAFCLGSPKDYSAIGSAIAKSTPGTKMLNQLMPSGYRSVNLSTPNQINLEEALALLDGSTIRLDASDLLADEDVREPAPDTTILRSAVFTGLIHSPQPNSLQFGTKLSLGEEFDDDLLLPSQINNQLSDNPSSVRRSSSGCQSPELTEPFEFSSQINWSPLGVEQEAEQREQPSGHVGSPQVEVGFNNPTSINTDNCDSPLVPLRRRAKKREHEWLQTQPETNVLEKGISLPGREFLLTQADDSGDESTGATSVSQLFDEYESSFIDDRQSLTEVSGSREVSSRLDTSDMLSVYLQTARSPPVGAARKRNALSDLLKAYKRQTARSPGSSNSRPFTVSDELMTQGSPEITGAIFDETKTTGCFLYSQIPEQDEEYELDSFCVNSADSTPTLSEEEMSLSRRPKKRRARHTTDQ